MVLVRNAQACAPSGDRCILLKDFKDTLGSTVVANINTQACSHLLVLHRCLCIDGKCCTSLLAAHQLLYYSLVNSALQKQMRLPRLIAQAKNLCWLIHACVCSLASSLMNGCAEIASSFILSHRSLLHITCPLLFLLYSYVHQKVCMLIAGKSGAHSCLKAVFADFALAD